MPSGLRVRHARRKLWRGSGTSCHSAVAIAVKHQKAIVCACRHPTDLFRDAVGIQVELHATGAAGEREAVAINVDKDGCIPITMATIGTVTEGIGTQVRINTT